MKRLALFIVLACCAPLLADVVVLKDGTRLFGDVKKGPDGYLVTQAGGKVRALNPDDVKSISPAGATTVPDASAAAAKLASLRRSVEFLDDPNKIIERYQRFIEQAAGSSVEADARKDLAMWQDRKQKGLVKFGNKWVTLQDRTALQEKSLAQADAVRKLLRAGKLAEAQSALDQALDQDPQNVTALYLRGLLQFRQDQVVASRKSFETVNALLPNHPPTLNNLAVILARQNQMAAALNMYDLAMIVSPRNRFILDNVAELLYAIPDEQRSTPVAQKVLRKFNEQDTVLAKDLATQGLHRWGATWVTSAQLESLHAAEQASKEKLDAMSADFDAVKVRISNIEREIKEDNDSMRRIEATSYVRDVNGNLGQAVLPSTYRDLQDEVSRLQRERTEQYVKLENLRQQAKAVDQDLPVPKFSGTQRLMDENSAPVIVPGASTARPTTAPTTAPAR
jgi:tetratricopeptide (TPR) repeat protein